MYLDDVLETQAEFDHEMPVRTIAPAIVLVLEREAPMRMETLASTEGEMAALQEECSSNPRWRDLLEVYFAAKADEEGMGHTDPWLREDEHAERLESGQRLSTLRVAETS